MTEEASVDDFEVCSYLKKKKKKKKKKKNHKEHSEKHENYESESIQNAELGPAPPLLLEDQAAQRDEGEGEVCKKKKKKKNKGEKQESLLDNSCVVLEHEISNETGVDVFHKKKKKKKRKHHDSTNEQSGVTENQCSTDNCQEIDADYVYLEQPVKKRRKDKLTQEDEVCELPTPEMCDNSDDKTPKKKKKKKKKKKRDSSTQDMQEDADVTAGQSLLSSPEQKKRDSSTQDMQEDADVTAGQSLLSSPEQNSQGEDTVLLFLTEEGGVASPQKECEDGDHDASPAVNEESADVPADCSKLTKAARRSRKTPASGRKAAKSRAFVMEENSSESDVKTPERSASNKKKKNSSSAEMAASDEPGLDDEEYLDSSVCSAMALDAARQELEEFIPHVRNISDSSIRKMAGRDLTRFKEFKKQGIAIKFGRFSKKENDQIRKNIEEFIAITGIDSAEKLLFTSRYPEDLETINRLKAEHLFCEKLSEGIPRPWRLIYYRARKMFDPNNYKGRYTKEEKEKLKKYHALHGNDWKKISEMMSRSNLSVAMKYSEIKSSVNYGPWSKEEVQKLMRAVEEVIRKRVEAEDANSPSSLKKSHRDLLIDLEKLCQKLPWTEIEAKVGTRYWRQCKQKWNTILTNKMTKGQKLYRGTKGLQAKINLIKRLYELKVEDANEVNWEELCDTIGNVPRSYVQTKFYKLKVSCVPLWRKKTFSEIIDYLFKKKLPELEEMLQKKKEKRHSPEDSTARRQKKAALRLSDIFDSSEESD